ncbi:hypothetical protein H6F74_00260 [Trichocoleus sp. FACHB-90]|uniref:hypothetical protein n=1 Tax=Cyanophyceae TaxID=3028117 RepID=UPI00168677F0|nr:hypothetical protein [Trichocoleus sp. FACHB-90]MBD1924726.1 hypothetical protein [Trichocoleus sp. FACHB-90]
MTGQSILYLAKKVASEATTSAHREAELGGSIHLAYYAAFTLAKKYLQDKLGQSIPTTGDAHQYVRKQFELRRDLAHQSVVKKSNNLRLFRNRTDSGSCFQVYQILPQYL